MGLRHLLALILALLIPFVIFAQSAKVKGRVMDSTGSVMPGVQVKVFQGDKVVQQGLTSDMGDFEIPINPGDYKLQISAPDFNTYTEMVKVTPDMGPLSVTLQLATFAQNVEVTETRNEISIDSDSSLQTTVLKQDFIDALPDDEDELTAYLSQIAGTRGDAGGGASFIIDGFTGGRVPPKDQIQEIRISNNPYSSEFSGIGFGRTEIITKAGTGDYHGSANFDFRDNVMNARQAFDVTTDGSPAVKPQAQTRNIQSNFSGPIIRNRLSANLNIRSFYNDNANIIRAIVPATDGSGTPQTFSQALVSPNKNKNMNVRTQLALNKNNTLYVNFQDQHRQILDQLAGTSSLPSRASDNTLRNSEFQLRETSILTKSIVHEFRFEYRTDYSQTTPRMAGQTVNVTDSFNSGSSQNYSTTNYKSTEFSNLLMYSGARWTVKAGFTAVDHMNDSKVQNNFLGTYTFATLGDYLGNNPLQFTQNSGNPALYVNQLELGGFVQTDWKVSKKLNLMSGVRYEAQTTLGYYKGFDPRFGFAFEINKTMALRGGLGTFRQRLDESIYEGTLRLDGTHQVQSIIVSPSYQPGCETSGNCMPSLNGSVANTLPPTSRVFSPNLSTPYTENWSLSLEKTLPGGLGLTFSWDHQRGEHLYRSRDINAPLPVSGAIPDPTRGLVYQLESSGLSKSNNYTVSFREQMRNRFGLQVFGNYTLGYQNNDTDGWQSTPVNNYDMRSEWGRSGNDYRHRIFTGTNFRLPWTINVTTQVNWNSSNPYTVATGRDDNFDGVINDRPTDTGLCQFLSGHALPGQNCAATTGAVISRNTGIGAGFFNTQFNFQKTIRLKRGEGSGSSQGGNNAPARGNNFVQPQGFPGGGGNFPGGGGNFPGGGGQRGGNFPGGGNYPGGGNNNGGFNQPTTGPTMTFRLYVQNLLNNVQYNGFIGTMASSQDRTTGLYNPNLGFFAKANSARNPRIIEASVRFNF